MNEEEIWEELKNVLKKFGRKKNLTMERSFQSLGIAGLELDDFFMDYIKTFNIDMTTYNPHKFFFQTVHPVHVIRDLFLRMFNPEKVRKKKLTLGHLVRVAERGKWFDPD